MITIYLWCTCILYRLPIESKALNKNLLTFVNCVAIFWCSSWNSFRAFRLSWYRWVNLSWHKDSKNSAFDLNCLAVCSHSSITERHAFNIWLPVNRNYENFFLEKRQRLTWNWIYGATWYRGRNRYLSGNIARILHTIKL